MREARRHNRFELRSQLMNTLGWQVQSKQLDGNESLAFGIVRPKDRT